MRTYVSYHTSNELIVGLAWDLLIMESIDAFDPYICAALHDKIISFLTRQAPAHNNVLVHNFFDAYGDGADAIRDRLTEPLIKFLENIDIMISTDPESSPAMNFAPHLCMPNPNEFWALNGGLSDLSGEDHENWVVLYLGMYCYLYFTKMQILMISKLRSKNLASTLISIHISVPGKER